MKGMKYLDSFYMVIDFEPSVFPIILGVKTDA